MEIKVLLTIIKSYKKRIVYYLELLYLINEKSLEYFEIITDIRNIEKTLNYIITLLKLSRAMDSKNVMLLINTGQGGIDAKIFSKQLYQMYRRHIIRYSLDIQYISDKNTNHRDDKQISLKVNGHNSYGYLKSEAGVHRLVRISPVNAKRHTSFVSVAVIPEISNIKYENISSSNIKIDTFRASGSGGQHVNKTDSAVRVTHLPTKATASCSSERSQIRNKAIALNILKQKIDFLKYNEILKKGSTSDAQKNDASFGYQIRSYILFPYKLIKDVRTKISTQHINTSLEGEINIFHITFLIWRYL